ncbi:MAG: hypothetical protein GQ583_10440 [Methyloprofundus sp.]|nr:hypothetical protein [Methyloprofundus sp.]
MKRSLLLVCTTLLALPSQADDLSPTLAEWQRTAQNPLSPNFSLPFAYTFHGGAPDGEVHIGSFAPIMPIRFDGWNIINQLTLNIMGTPGDITGIRGMPEPYTGTEHGGSDGYAAGLADTYFTSYFSPRINDEFSLGLGATFVFPTDEPTRELGSGKFSVWPAVMLVYQTPKDWTLGLQAQQIWSVIGSSERSEVSQMILRPTVNYNLPDGWYLASDMEVIANWNSSPEQRWTVPIGVGIGKLFAVDGNAIDTRVEGYYNVVTPDQGPTWSIHVSFSFIFAEL